MGLMHVCDLFHLTKCDNPAVHCRFTQGLHVAGSFAETSCDFVASKNFKPRCRYFGNNHVDAVCAHIYGGNIAGLRFHN